MLVIGRKDGETFWLERDGERIATVMVVRSDRGTVHLGVDAPRSVTIQRDNMRRGPQCTDSEK